MCAVFASVEWRMFCLFVRLSDTPVAIARATFYSHHNAANRASMVEATAAMVLRGTPELDAALADLRALLTSINRSARKRNAYIHDPWAMEPDKPGTICQLRMGGSHINARGARVAEKDLRQLGIQFDEYAEQLHDFDERIAPLLPASLGTLDRTRSVSLEFAPTRFPRGTSRAKRQRPRGSSPAKT